MNIKEIKPENILFLDIETVPQYESYDQLPEAMTSFWDKKSSYLIKEEESPSSIYQRAGIYAEFGKIICISVGNIHSTNGKMLFRMKSFYGDNESGLLKNFCSMINNFSHNKDVMLAAHNGKEFDFPYMARRMIINEIPLPRVLQVSGKKPWEVPFIDTLELWKFGDYKHYTSLDLLTYLLKIPSPKDDIDGSMVADIYYKEKDLERIVRYCEKDVVAVVQLFLKFSEKPLLEKENIISVTFDE